MTLLVAALTLLSLAGFFFFTAMSLIQAAKGVMAWLKRKSS